MKYCRKIAAVLLFLWGLTEMSYIAADYQEGEAIYTEARMQQLEQTAKEQSADMVGWLYMDQIGIDYPVVQGEDNEFYLTHAYDRTEHAGGSIMMNCDNGPAFSDLNTILYGHNMKNGTMFGRLSELPALKEELAEIIVETPGGEWRYQILCIAKVRDDNPIFQMQRTEAEFISCVEALKGDALYWRERKDDQAGQFLTLVTCSGEFKLVVIAGYTDL